MLPFLKASEKVLRSFQVIEGAMDHDDQKGTIRLRGIACLHVRNSVLVSSRGECSSIFHPPSSIYTFGLGVAVANLRRFVLDGQG